MAYSAGKLKKELIGNGCIMAATVFWGINYAFTKALVPDWMSAEAVSAVRLLGGCLLFWLTSLFIHCEKLDSGSMIRAIFSGLALFGCIYLFVVALKYGSAIDISIIMTLQPVFVIAIEVLFLRRRPGFLEYVGMAVSLAGAVMIILCGSNSAHAASNYLLGDFLAIVAGICFAVYLVILAKPTSRYSPVSLLRWVFLYSAIPGLFLVPSFFNMPLLECDSLAPWLEIGFILVGPTYLAYLFNQPAIHDIGPVLSALYQYLVPVVAAISAVMLGVDSLRWQQVVAMAIIVAGMILTNFGKKSEKSRA
ncbi:MAG: EamA family transporter [Desulfovibrio sp.]|nr:EamA family transporter [Desulfovibrio sp.]